MRDRIEAVLYAIQLCCVSWLIMYCVVLSQPLWCRCPSRCFIATGYSIGFGQWYRRYCGICISFPQSPVGQPGAVYLSGYKAASQRAKGKGNRTEVGVKGTGCRCVFQQGCEICKCTAEGGFIIQRAVCDSYKQAYVYERFHPHRRTICAHRTHEHTLRHECKYVYPSALCINPFCRTFSHSLPFHSEQICSACTILFI